MSVMGIFRQPSGGGLFVKRRGLMQRSILDAFDRIGGINREELEPAKLVDRLVTVPAICKIDSGVLR